MSNPKQTPMPPGNLFDRRLFDLDKTSLQIEHIGFQQTFLRSGLINRRAVLKSTYAQFLFLMSGADIPNGPNAVVITNMCTGGTSNR